MRKELGISGIWFGGYRGSHRPARAQQADRNGTSGVVADQETVQIVNAGNRLAAEF